MPEWVHWIIEGLFGLFAIYVARRLDSSEREKREWVQRLEVVGARLNAVESLIAADRAWRSANETHRDDQHSEHQRRMSVIDHKQDQVLDKLDELSNRLATTRGGNH